MIVHSSEPKMKNLYRLQIVLVVFFSFMIPSWTFGQFADPIQVNIKNTGSSYTDQFSATIEYSHIIVQHVGAQFGTENFSLGSGNTLKVMFTPNAGAIGSTDLIVSYYTLSSPIHPVTRWYRFNLFNEVVVSGKDKYVVDKGGVD